MSDTTPDGDDSERFVDSGEGLFLRTPDGELHRVEGGGLVPVEPPADGDE